MMQETVFVSLALSFVFLSAENDISLPLLVAQ